MKKPRNGAILIFVIATGLILWGIITVIQSDSSNITESGNAAKVISRRGIHWHPELHIFMKGEEMPIPAGIGLGIVHNPIHTHDADNVLHLEFSGLVREDDIRLEKFFEVWKKTFDEQCIFENCTGPGGTLAMSVDGEPSTEFQNLVMADGMRIEIRYD